VFQVLHPVCAKMGPDDGGLLGLAMSNMPNVVREFTHKIDVGRTFYESKNRNTVATSKDCDLTNLGHSLFEVKYQAEEGFPSGYELIRTCSV
jgi:hypothetical protein